MIKTIKCLLGGDPVECIATDGSKFILAMKQDGSWVREKAAFFISYAERAYNFKFSRKLLTKLPVYEDMWEDKYDNTMR